DPSDFDCRLAFNVGLTAEDVYLADINVTQLVTSVEKSGVQSVAEYKLIGNYPNPFNEATKICFSLAGKSLVKINVYNLLGELQDTICFTDFSAGRHEVNFHAGGLASGVYFYRMEVDTPTGSYQDVQKMIYVK
ncbi:T9SS type A sorting domain-containing protein, partial [candidate division KSB1 bacterium]|nr:T9SS type A sorting domain-containing protein [candidate division KSB1 bacterium]